MKNLLTLCIIFISLQSFASGPKNILILEGEICNKERATIIVFEYDSTDCYWQRVEEQKSTRSYTFMLNPESSYQIWFMQEGGYLKVMYIDPGDQGLFNVKINIDFNNKQQIFARLYQDCDHIGITYTAEYTSESQIGQTPANNCGSCIAKN